MAAAGIRMTDVISKYDGVGNITVWLKQLRRAKEALKIESLAAIVPLLPEEGPFTVYDLLSDEQQKDFDEIENALLRTYTKAKISALNELRTRNIQPGEKVDVFLGELMKLVKIVGVEQEDNSPLLKWSFLSGLPRSVSTHLEATHDVDKMKLDDLVPLARGLVLAGGDAQWKGEPALKNEE